jgi:hypothetical protein
MMSRGRVLSGLIRVVPIGAHYLFIGTENSYAGYNSDPNRDFALTITPLPEPSTLLALRLARANSRG